MSTQIGGARTVASRLFPESMAGGFSHVDGSVEFYGRINALLDSAATVVDLGAGRGGFTEDPVPHRRELRRLQGKVARVIGLDVDPVVLENPTVDEAHVLVPGRPFPLPDRSVDIIVSDYTFEHIDDPSNAAAEMRRILRPGGWLCARTPNKWGYIGLSTRAVPNRLHDGVLARVQPEKQQRDTFPTRYRLNTMADLKRYFPEQEFAHHSYTMDSEPAYFGESELAWRTVLAMFRFTPSRCRSVLYVFLRKRG